MKNLYKFLGVIAIGAVIGFTLAGCGDSDDPSNSGGSGNNSGGITFSGVTADGSTTQTTTQLILIFNQAIDGLTANDIILTGVNGVNKGTLNGSGPTYTLPINGFNSGGNLSVIVAKTGYTISGSPQAVAIYYSAGNNPPGGGGGTAPSTPSGVTATAQSSSSISVSWSAVSGATSYDVYYEIGSSSTKNFAGNTSSTSYTHTGLQANTTYYYYIKAKNSAGESDYSSYSSNASATTQSSSSGGGGGGTTVEYRLDQPIFGTCSKSGNNLTINWSLTTSGKTPNGLYTYTSPSNIIIQVYNGTSFDNIQTLPATTRTYTLTNYPVFQYSPAGVSGNRVTIRVYCISGSSSYDSRYATITYSVEQNYWSPTY